MNNIVDEFLQLSNERPGPFPYDDCFRIIDIARLEIANSTCRGFEVINDREIGDFVPDLAWYDAKISGIASWGKWAVPWDDKRIKMAEDITKRSFFEDHPEYQILRNKITSEDTPVLYEYIVFQEAVRTGVLQILALLVA
ncbi:MAG: hypothetical protein V4671_21825 [Armatimonadota bacterium]